MDFSNFFTSATRPYFQQLAALLLAFTVSACGGGGSSNDGGNNPPIEELSDTEKNIVDVLNFLPTNTDFTLLIESQNRVRFSHSVGDSSSSHIYESASTSKLVTAAVILSLVRDGILALDDNPQDYISYWPTSGSHSTIQLRHLLNFTSGLISEPLCINLALANFEDCVESILDSNASISSPGTEFYYGSSHMQVAGLMAMRASGVSTWTELFDNFKAETGLFSSGQYDLPSAANPRLAGGMHWRADEYVDFLSALFHQEIISPSLINELVKDQIDGADIIFSPVLENDVGQDWHYGFGVWIECSATIFNCTQVTRVSSAGAYGSYPFIDYQHNYIGIIARQGPLGSGDQGFAIYEQVADELATWASEN
ncbi:serine hydrolase domain-containing protein [Aurantivibrio plasticivorans]